MRDVSFAYGEQADLALANINLAIDEGSFVGIIGPSGAGKSTLASILSGAIPHHYSGSFYGETRVAGLDTCEVTLTDIARVVGSVLQDIDAQMVASVVEDEMLFGLENFGVPPRPDRGARHRRAGRRGHHRPARPRDRDALRRAEAEGGHRRDSRPRAARPRPRRADRRARPGELARGLRDPARGAAAHGRHRDHHRADGRAACGVLRAHHRPRSRADRPRWRAARGVRPCIRAARHRRGQPANRPRLKQPVRLGACQGNAAGPEHRRGGGARVFRAP